MTSNILAAAQRASVFLLALAAAGALVCAFIAQYGFGLEPCELCLYQRVPYAAAVLLGILYIFVRRPRPFLMLLAICFAADAAIAAFHVGVEQHWWEGLSSCSASLDASNLDALREQILNGPRTRCDQAAWSMFGISMAGYNFMLALGLCAASVFFLKKEQ